VLQDVLLFGCRSLIFPIEGAWQQKDGTKNDQESINWTANN
jgi:hypothetical protein